MKPQSGPCAQCTESPSRRSSARTSGIVCAPLGASVVGLLCLGALVTGSSSAVAQQPPAAAPAPPAAEAHPAPAQAEATVAPTQPVADDASAPADAPQNPQAAPETAPSTARPEQVSLGPDAARESEELVPLAEPAPAAPLRTQGAQAPSETNLEAPRSNDSILYSGYLPGYRRHMALGASPYSPRVGALPGGVTGGYGAPVPPSEWAFEYSGFISASLQFSVDSRRYPAEGQADTVYHTPPETIETWNSFTSTNTVPGNWVSMRFKYGNSRVSAHASMETWNPSRPATYYHVGSQYFLNNVFLSYTPAPIGDVRLRIDAGRYNTAYGRLARYNAGIYTNSLSGEVDGVGERIIAEYDLSDSYMVVLEHGLMQSRDGQIPEQVIPSIFTSWRRHAWTGAWLHHEHLGLIRKGEPRVELQGHYITNWTQEDRNSAVRDIPGTQQLDESRVYNGRITVWGGDLKLLSDTFGVLGVGGAMIRGHSTFPLKGLITYAEDGEQLTNKWWGVTSGGTGKILVLAGNYEFSLGKIVSYPQPFGGDGPDILVNTGFQWTKTWTDFENFDGRTRHKYGMDVLYRFIEYVGAGVRVDRVVPTSYTDEETFHVLATRMLFKSSWSSNENIQLIYAKWFYGSESRNEGTGLRTPEQLDDELFALNFNMWW